MIQEEDFSKSEPSVDNVSVDIIEKYSTLRQDEAAFWLGFLFRDLFAMSSKYGEEIDPSVKEVTLRREIQQTYDCLYLINQLRLEKWRPPLMVLVKDLFRRKKILDKELKIS